MCNNSVTNGQLSVYGPWNKPLSLGKWHYQWQLAAFAGDIKAIIPAIQPTYKPKLFSHTKKGKILSRENDVIYAVCDI